MLILPSEQMALSLNLVTVKVCRPLHGRHGHIAVHRRIRMPDKLIYEPSRAIGGVTNLSMLVLDGQGIVVHSINIPTEPIEQIVWLSRQVPLEATEATIKGCMRTKPKHEILPIPRSMPTTTRCPHTILHVAPLKVSIPYPPPLLSCRNKANA